MQDSLFHWLEYRVSILIFDLHIGATSLYHFNNTLTHDEVK